MRTGKFAGLALSAIAMSGMAMFGLSLSVGAAAAVSQPTNPVPSVSGTDTPAPDNSTQTPSKTPSGSGSLSHQLQQSNGTVKPPPVVDPGMSVPAPSTGPQSMPVVPPPGSPGSNSAVQPK